MLLLLGAPLVDAGMGASGTCRLAMEIQAGGDGRLAGVMAEVGDGRVRSCTPLLRGAADAWALGSPSAWLDAMAHGEVAGIECGGDAQLAHAIVSSLHRALSEAPAIPT